MAGIRFLCCTSGFRTDGKLEVEAKLNMKAINRRLNRNQKTEAHCLKLLLLGTGESGKSTILKQMKIIHINGYSDEEKLAFVPTIRRNIRDAILSVLGGMRVLGIDYEQSENAVMAQQFLEWSVVDECTYPERFFEQVDLLWQDEGVRQAYCRSSDYQLIDSAKYFLDQLGVIRQKDYIPSDQDILRCRTMSDGINEVQFEITTEQKRPVRFRVFDVSGQRGARKKWIQYFDSVTAIVYLVDCGSFEQSLREDHNQNRLIDSLEVFEQAWSNKYLQNIPMIVFLNKIDVLDEKIRAGQRISRLQSVASAWLCSHELRKCELSMYSLHESPEYAPGNTNAPDNHGRRVRRPRSSNTTTVITDNGCGQKSGVTPNPTVSTSSNGNLLVEINQPNNEEVFDENAKPSTNQKVSTRSSLSSFNRSFRLLSPVDSVRRFRRSFRQASLLPVPTLSDSSGVTSRVSCTVLVARVILSNPYGTFVPTTAEQEEFTSSIKFIAGQPNSSNLTETIHSTELRVPHRETVRTACYIKHLFQELTKQSVHSCTTRATNRKCLFYYTCAVNTDSIRKVLESCRNFLLEDHLDHCGKKI